MQGHPAAKGMASNAAEQMEEEIRLGSQDVFGPEQQPLQNPSTGDVGEEDFSETPTSRRTPSGMSNRGSGSKRKRSSLQFEVLDVMRTAMDMHASHMRSLLSWQKEKYDLEAARRKEIVDHLYAIEGLTEDDRIILIDIIVADIQKTGCFLQVPTQSRKRYCLHILGRSG